MVTSMTSKKMAGEEKNIEMVTIMKEASNLVYHKVEGCIDGQTGQNMRVSSLEDFDQVEAFCPL